MSLKPSLASAVALLLCSLAFAACGGGDSGNGSESGSSSGNAVADDEAGLEFAECMREEGVDVPDPQAGGGPIQGEGGPGFLDDPAAQEALEKCQEELGDVGPQNLSASEQQELEDAALEFAECMREQGVDVPDPQFGEGPGGGFGQALGEEADTPAFQEASEACQDELPAGPGGGPPGPGGPPGAGG